MFKAVLLNLFFFSVSSFSQEKQVFYGHEQATNFERKTCAEILKDHRPATEMSHQPDRPHKQMYFDYFRDPLDCSKVTSNASPTEIITRKLTFKDSPLKEQKMACVQMNMKYMAEHYKDLDKLAKVVQARMTIHDAVIYGRNPDLFTSSCSNGIIQNTFLKMRSSGRPEKDLKDSQLLLKLNYDKDESARCQVRSNARQKDIELSYTNLADWKDRSLCQTFLTNWNEWKRLNEIKEMPVYAAAPPEPEEDKCKLSCSWIKSAENFRLPASMTSNKCIFEKYLECVVGGEAPASTPSLMPAPVRQRINSR